MPLSSSVMEYQLCIAYIRSIGTESNAAVSSLEARHNHMSTWRHRVQNHLTKLSCTQPGPLPSFRHLAMVTNSWTGRSKASLHNVLYSTVVIKTMPSSPDQDSLCDRIQQFRQRMKTRCIEHREDAAAAGIPCLLQAWRKRIEAMEKDPQTHRHRGRHCRRLCTSKDSESDDSPSCPFRAPRMLHPKLERQQAVCSLSEIWNGLTSSPPPSPEIYAKPRHRPHPYSRCFTDDHGKSSQ